MPSDRNRLTAQVVFLAVGLACCGIASAAPVTWNGASSGGTWFTSNANWNTETLAPWNSGNGSSNIALFDTAGLTLTVNGTVFANGITFTQSATLSGGNITLSGTTPTITGTGTISSVLTGSARLTKSGAGTLTLNGTNTYTGGTSITGGTVAITSDSNLGAVPGIATASSLVIDSGILSTSGNFTVSANRGIAIGPTSGTGNGTINVASGELTYSGIITSNGGAGTGSLVKSGTGTLTLGGVNTYTGNTDISAGTLKIASAAALPSGPLKGDVTITGTLDLNANSITLNGLSGAGLITSSTAGNVTLTAGANNKSGNFTGTIQNGSGTVALTKTGSLTLTLGGNNTFTGGVTINAGTLQLANAGALNSSAPNSVTFGASAPATTKLQINGNSVTIGALATNATVGTVVIENANAVGATLTVNQTTNTTFAGAFQNGTGGGALSLTKNGTGTLTLNGTNTHTGTTTINAGTLALGGGSAIADTGAVVLADAAGAILKLNASETIGSLAGGGASGGNVDLQSFTLNTGGANTDTTYSGVISGNGALIKTGTGNMTLGRANTFAGSTTVKNGGIILGVASALPITTSLILGDGTANTSALLKLNGFAQTLVGLTTAGTGTANRVVGGSATTANLTLSIASSNTFGGTLGGVGLNENNLSLIKTGNGTLILTGNNTYSGNTTVSAGTLSAGNMTNALGTATTAVVLGDASNTGTLSHTGTSASFSRNITVSAGGGQIDTTTSGQTLTLTGSVAAAGAFTLGGAGNSAISGNITGAGSLNKTGAGSLTLSGNNTYSGATNIKSGSVILAVNDTGLKSTTTLTLGDATANSNGVLKLDGYTQTLAGLVTAGTGQTNRVVGGNATLSTLTLNNSGANPFSGILGGPGTNENNLTLVKTGAGVLTLSGTSTYTGGTSINAGTIAVGAAANLGATSGNLSIGAGVLQVTATHSSSRIVNLTDATSAVSVDNGFTFTDSGNITGTGALNLTGNGTMVVSGAASTYSGGTNIRNGTLTLGANNALSTTNTAVALGSGTVSGKLALNGFNQTLTSLTMNGTGAANRVVNGSATLSTLTINNASDTVFNGILGGTGTNEDNLALTKTGVGKLTINSTNSYAGNTTISQGTLSLASAAAISGGTGKGNVLVEGTLDVNGFSPGINGLSGNGSVLNNGATGKTIYVGNNNATSTFNGTILDGTGSLALTKNGTGVLTLNGANTYTGNTTVTLGTLKIGNAAAVPSGVGVGNVTLTAGILDLNGNSITVNGLTGAGNVTSTATGNIVFSVGANDQSSIYTGIISNGTATTLGLTKVGTGTLTLNGTNTYNGDTTISAGTLKYGANNVIANGAGKGNVTISSGAWLDINGRLTGNATVNGLSGSGNVTNSSATAGVLTAGSNNATSTFDGILQDGAGALALTKTGNGTLTLNGTNTYTGLTTISQGTLALSNGAAIVDAGNVTLSATAGSNALLQLNSSETIGSLAGGSTTGGNVTLQTYTLTTGGANNTTTYNGSIAGTGSLVKIGTGTQTLNGTSSYTGGTTISGGILAINKDLALGATSGNLSIGNAKLQVLANITASPRNIALTDAASTIIVDTGVTLTNNSVISGTGMLNKEGRGVLQISGNQTNTYSGGTTVKAGLLEVLSLSGAPFGQDVNTNNITVTEGSNLSLSSTGNKGANQTITVNSTGSALGGIGFSNTGLTQAQLTGNFTDNTLGNGGVLSINNSISYNLAINLSTLGSGNWFLGSASTGTYSGTNATLTVGANFTYRLGGGGGSLTMSQTNVLTGANNVLVGSSSANGNGTVTISTAQNYTGNTTVTGTAVLAVGGDDRLGTGTGAGNIVLDNGTLRASNTFTLASGRGIALGSATGNATGTIDTNNAGTLLTYGGNMTDNGSGADSLTKIGAGTLILTNTGISTFTGAVNINAGTINFARIENFGLGSAINFNGGTLQYATGNTADITARTVTTTATGGATVDIGTNNVAFANAITGTGSFTKNGTGTLTLNAANTYTGNTTIAAGGLKLGIATAIPSGAGNGWTAVNGNGTIDVNNFNPTLNALAGNGTVTNSGTGATTLTVNATAASTFNGVINNGSGTMSLVKTGANALTLNGTTSTYSGGTTITAGTLAITNDGALGAVPETVAPANIAIASGATLGTTTNMTLNSNRGIVIGSSSGVGNGTLAVSANTTLTYNGTIANNGSGTGELIKSTVSTGVLVLGGVNTYSGNTTISGGTLKITNAAAIPFGPGKGNLTLTTANSSVLDLNGNTITVNGLSGAGNVTTSVAGAAGITVGANDATSSFSGLIQNGSGTVSLTKTGAGTLTLNGTSTYTGGTTLSGGNLSIIADANLGGSTGLLTIGNGTLQVTANIAASTRNVTLTDASSAISVSPGVSLTNSGNITGAGALNLTGNGTMVVSGTANDYSGGTNIRNGTLSLGAANALPTGTLVTLGNGTVSGKLALNSFSQTLAGITTNGTGTTNSVVNGNATAATLTINNSSASTFNGTLGGGGLNENNFGLTKTGSGTFAIGGNNTYTGDTTVSAGSLEITSGTALPSGAGKGNVTVNASLDIDVNVTVNGLSGSGKISTDSASSVVLTAGANDQTSTFSGNITNGSGTLGLTKTGTGNLTLSGNNTFSGATTISTGKLVVGSSTGLSSASAVTVSLNTFLDVNGFDVTMDGLNGTGTINNNGAANATLTAGASNGTSSFGGVLADGTKSLSLTKSGTGTLTLTGTNTYTGATTISNGSISAANIGAGGNLGSGTSPVILGDATNKGSLIYTGATDLSYTRGFTVNAGGGQVDVTTAGKTLTLQTAGITTAGTFTVGGNGSVVISSAISGAGGFAKAGTGAVVLASANSYAGDTTVSSGTLQVTNASAIPSGTGKGNVAVNGNGTLDVNNLSLTLNGLSGNGTVTNTAGSPVTLTVGDNNSTGNFTGLILDGTGITSLTKIGTGTQTLGGANTYSGNTTISAGTLQIGLATAIPSGVGKGNVSIASGGTLNLNDFDVTLNGLSGAGLVTNNLGASTLTVGDNSQSGNFTGNIQDGLGTIGLTKIGTGTLTLSGNNTFSGATLISQGTVSMGSNTGLSAASTLTIDNAGALDLNGRVIAIDGLAGTGSITNNNATPVMLTVGSSGGSGTFGGTINDGTGVIGLTKTGSGTVTLSNTNTYSGGTVVTGGLLGITSYGALGAIPASPTPGNIVLNGGGISAINTFEINSNRGIAVGPASGSGSGILSAALNQNLTYNGIIANNGSGTGGLTTSGAGTVTLGGNNTYSGDTTVSSGSLQVASVNAIPFGTGKGNLVLNSTLDLNNLGITVNGLSGGGTVSNTKAGAVTLSVGDNNQSSTFSGLIENGNGATALTKIGSGTLTLTGNNTYTGNTTISAGVLSIGSDLNIGTGTLAIAAGATLAATESFTLNPARSILVGSSGNGTIDVLAGKTVTYAGVIANNGASGGFTKSGTGILILTGNSTFTGATTVANGTLTVLGSMAGSTSLSVLTGATLTGTGTTGAMEVKSDGTLSPGNNGIGTLTVSGFLSLDGISNFELGTPGVSHASPGISDRVAVTGNVTYGGTINLINNNNVGGLGSAGAGSYQLITYTGTASGNFTGVTGLPEYHNAFHDVPADKALYIDLYDYAVAAITPSVDLGRIHAGGTFGNATLTVANTAPAGNFTESLAGNFTTTPAGFTSSGSVTGIAGGSSNNSSMVVGISDNTAGAKNGTLTLGFTSQAVAGSGLSDTARASQNVGVTGFAYSGQSTWAATGSGTWGNNTNNYAMWDTAGGTPGLDGALSANDTATFGAAITAPATVTLDGASPSLKAVTFDSANAYTLAQGTGNGTLHLKGNGGAASLTLTSGNHTISAPITLDTAANVAVASGNRLTISDGGISGANGLTKSGDGVLAMTGTSTYTGTTTVSTGTLLVNGTLGNTATTVASGATLAGTGTINAAVTVNGIIAPGDLDTIGSFAANSLTLNGTLAIQWNGTTNAIDLLNITGLLDLKNTSTVSFAGLEGSLTQAAYIFATYGSLSGSTFANVTDLPTGYEIKYSYNGKNIALVAVPEPAVWVLLTIGLTLLVIRGRRRGRLPRQAVQKG